MSPPLRDLDILLILRRETQQDWAVIYLGGDHTLAYWLRVDNPKEFPGTELDDTGYVTVDDQHVVDENGVILEVKPRG
jgi:hypothetical protein